jgi:hypothetical protein
MTALRLILVASLVAATQGINVEKWAIFTAGLDGPQDSASFNAFEVELATTFTHTLTDSSMTVAGFYDGDGKYLVRFMPSQEGNWSYKTSSKQQALDGETGSFSCIPPSKGNHGPVTVSSGKKGFAYGDGTPFIPVGTTSYAWLHQPQGATLEVETLKTLSKGPFNKARFTIFPKYYPFTHDEPRWYPFQGTFKPSNCSWDYGRFDPAFWQHVESRLQQVLEAGIIADIILFHPYDGGHWGFDRMNDHCDVKGGGTGIWCDQNYLRYVAARLSSYRNVWWSMANEWDLMKSKTVADWDTLFKTLAAADPYKREISVHNCHQDAHGYYNHSQPWISHISLQVK